MKKLFLLTIIFLFFSACTKGAEETEFVANIPSGVQTSARNLSVFRTEETVNMTRANGLELPATAGARLHEDYRVATENNSFCYISFDNTSLIKMDELSRVFVFAETETLLSVAVIHGQILVDVQEQPPEQMTEIHIGGAILGIRGTLFVAAQRDGFIEVTMLEGAVETDTRKALDSPSVTRIFDDG